MNGYERGLLIVGVSSLIIYFLVVYLDRKGKYDWIKWYRDLSKEEKLKYEPSQAFKRMKYSLVINFFVALLGLFLSINYNKVFHKISFNVIILVFIVGIISSSRYYNQKES